MLGGGDSGSLWFHPHLYLSRIRSWTRQRACVISDATCGTYWNTDLLTRTGNNPSPLARRPCP